MSGPGWLSRCSDSLWAGRSGDGNRSARFSAPVQTGPGYRVSLPEVKRPGPGFDHPPPSSAEVKERVETPGPSWPVLGRTLYVMITYFLFHIIQLYNAYNEASK